jgi:vacuolar-type H+-ATPase catalytic subunit A/Vma1
MGLTERSKVTDRWAEVKPELAERLFEAPATIQHKING